eukprot:365370-Chlamydomonas_euryale.AAC.12
MQAGARRAPRCIWRRPLGHRGRATAAAWSAAVTARRRQRGHAAHSAGARDNGGCAGGRRRPAGGGHTRCLDVRRQLAARQAAGRRTVAVQSGHDDLTARDSCRRRGTAAFALDISAAKPTARQRITQQRQRCAGEHARTRQLSAGAHCRTARQPLLPPPQRAWRRPRWPGTPAAAPTPQSEAAARAARPKRARLPPTRRPRRSGTWRTRAAPHAAAACGR